MENDSLMNVSRPLVYVTCVPGTGECVSFLARVPTTIMYWSQLMVSTTCSARPLRLVHFVRSEGFTMSKLRSLLASPHRALSFRTNQAHGRANASNRVILFK